MRGHLRKRGKDTWAIVIDLPKDPASGKRHQQWHTVHGTRRDAERALSELLHWFSEQGNAFSSNSLGNNG